MYQIAIVEDVDIAAQAIEGHLTKFGEEFGEQFHITRFRYGMQFLTKYQAIYDIVFMDIEMPLLNGMDTATKFRELDQTTILIFVTNLTQYAIRGYEVDALDYILKPVGYAAFSMKMRRALRRVVPLSSHKIVISTKSGDFSISVNSIKYIDSVGHQITYHTEEKEYQAYGTLKNVEASLPEGMFYRCNSGILVNLDFVVGISGNDVLLSNESLPVSRARKKEFTVAVHERQIQRGKV